MKISRDMLQRKHLVRIILYVALLTAGILSGAITQKLIGFGNLLRSVGVPYPTAAPSSASNISPVIEIPKAQQGKLHLFILAGQSNMVGWAPVPPDEKAAQNIYVFGADYQWHIAKDPIFNAHNQVDKVSENRIAGFGPSLPFAIASLERNPDILIGLIPCAKNSSAIIQWQRNLGDQSLYGSCLKRALAASSMGQLSGLLFFQGEQDAVDPIQYPHPESYPEVWSQLFTTFITDLRYDLREPTLLVVYAQLGADPGTDAFPNWSVVKEQQASVSINRSAMITTDDLPLMDGLHFTADSYRIIGRRFADAYWSLLEEK